MARKKKPAPKKPTIKIPPRQQNATVAAIHESDEPLEFPESPTPSPNNGEKVGRLLEADCSLVHSNTPKNTSNSTVLCNSMHVCVILYSTASYLCKGTWRVWVICFACLHLSPLIFSSFLHVCELMPTLSGSFLHSCTHVTLFTPRKAVTPRRRFSPRPYRAFCTSIAPSCTSF